MCSGTSVDSHVVWAFLTVDVVKAIWIVDVDCGYSVVDLIILRFMVIELQGSWV